MKKVLIITYYFPPSGGPGVQRVLKFIKYLPQFGWQPIVFTVSNGQFLGYDESLINDINKNIKIFKSRTIEPYSIYNMLSGKERSSSVDVNIAEIDYENMTLKQKIMEFVRATFFIPDARIGWRFTATSKLKEIIADNKPDAVYTSSPPYTTALLGKYVKKKFGIPWVLSLRDPWIGYKGTPDRWAIPGLIEREMEKSVFRQSDAIEVAWHGIIEDAINKYPELDREKFNVIFNGFDPDDIPAHSGEKNRKFTVTYTGTLYSIQDPSLLFRAVSELAEDGKVDRDKIQFKFIGRIADEIREKINQLEIKDNISLLGYMSHKEVMKELSGSDVSLLIGVNSKEKYVNVPGKTFEYIGIGNPVFLIAPPQSTLSDIVAASGLGLAIDHNDLDKMKQVYYQLYKSWLQNDSFSIDKNKINLHSRINGAEKLAKILDNI